MLYILRLVAAVVVAAAMLVVSTRAASAHIEPEPRRVKPGKPVTVGFGVDHGCNGLPTTMLMFRIPKGATKIAAVGKPGWTARVDGKRTVTFSGGPLLSEETDAFSITFTPANRKTELIWKVVQVCNDERLRWIETGVGSEYPAPVIAVGRSAGDKSYGKDNDHSH